LNKQSSLKNELNFQTENQMKFKHTLFLITSIFFFSFSHAQTNTGWMPVWLGADGTNSFSGVEAYYQVTTCNNVEVVQLKLINHHTYAVKAGWKGMVLTNSDEKLYGNNQADSVLIAANAQVVGDCSGNTPSLTRNLTDFSTDVANLKTYLTTSFDFIVIQ
jgi:hypothetical protein